MCEGEREMWEYGKGGMGSKQRQGRFLTWGQMITEGTYEWEILADGWTAVTQDGKLSAKFEQTLG